MATIIPRIVAAMRKRREMASASFNTQDAKFWAHWYRKDVGRLLGHPVCPDCKIEMVKTRVYNDEGDWVWHWFCECRVGPPEDK